MIDLHYRERTYKGVTVVLKTGEDFVYGEEGLYDDMNYNNDIGCALDNEICYYTSLDTLEALDELVKHDASDQEIIDFCNSKSIYIGEYTVETKEKTMEQEIKETIAKSVTDSIVELINKAAEAKASELKKSAPTCEEIKNMDEATIKDILDSIRMEHSSILEEFIESLDDGYIKKCDIDIDVVDECGLSQNVFDDFFDNMYESEKKDFIKEAIDNL